MSSPHAPPPPPAAPPEPREGSLEETQSFRFGLRTLFRAVTALAIVCAIASILPAAFSQLLAGALWIVALSVVVTGVVFAEGDRRAFCIGATIAFTSTWTGVGGRLMGAIRQIAFLMTGIDAPLGAQLWLDLAVLTVMAAGNGALCVAARRYFQRP